MFSREQGWQGAVALDGGEVLVPSIDVTLSADEVYKNPLGSLRVG